MWGAPSSRWHRIPVGPVGTRSRSTPEYGFTDVDGSQPNVWRFIEDISEKGLDAPYEDYR